MSKKKHTTRKKSSPKSSSGYGSLWVIVLFFILLLAAILYYLSDYTDFDAIKRDLAQTRDLTSEQTSSTTHDTTRFEFYQLLPEMKVSTGVKPQQQESTSTSTVPSAPPPKIEYLLQVASFRHLAEADSLKAQLILLGFDVAISTSQQQDITWYRVRLGPFATRPQAEDMRKALRKHQYDSLLQTRKQATG
ncbi:MAG: hypothetical protein GKR77_02245 [Legionellales bacterium]|nr:hypothetical protein [Legionellales bacterium]